MALICDDSLHDWQNLVDDVFRVEEACQDLNVPGGDAFELGECATYLLLIIHQEFGVVGENELLDIVFACT